MTHIESAKIITLVSMIAGSISLACESRSSAAEPTDAAPPPPPVTPTSDAGPPPTPTVIFQAKVPSHRVVCSCTCNAGTNGKETQTFDVPLGGDCASLHSIACTKKQMTGILEKCFKDAVAIPKQAINAGVIDGIGALDE